MRTLSSETSFVEMGEEKFFKWFPKFGTKSYQKYLNCMEILWVNKHALRRMYISHRSRFTEKKVFFWLKKLLLKWTSNFLNKKFFNLKNLFLINLLLLVNVLLWRATPSQLIKLFWRGYPFQPMLGLTSWMSWFPVPVTTFSIVPAYKTQVRWDAGTVAECGPSILYSGLLHCPEARGVTVLAGTVFGKVNIWNGVTGDIINTLERDNRVIFSVTYSRNPIIVTTSNERSSLVYTCGEAGLNNVDGRWSLEADLGRLADDWGDKVRLSQ